MRAVIAAVAALTLAAPAAPAAVEVVTIADQSVVRASGVQTVKARVGQGPGTAPAAGVTFAGAAGGPLGLGSGRSGCAGVDPIACDGPVHRIELATAAGHDRLEIAAGLAAPLEWSAGAGFDALVAAEAAAVLAVTLDDVANDTLAAAGRANVRSDVEDLHGHDAADLLVGSSGPNDIAGGGGADRLDGGGGYDTLDAGAGDDVVLARDGLAELVDCGSGTDSATLDDVDEAIGCENVIADGQGRPDADRDGVRAPLDCDDADAAVRPGAVEIPDNGTDEDCDGSDPISFDRDADGVPRPRDCNDNDAAVRPGLPELPGNRRDDDCDGVKEPFPRIGVRLRQTTGADATGTRFLVLRLIALSRGATVTVECSGRGCPFRRRAFNAPARGRTVNLRAAAFGNRRIAAGGRLTIRVTDRRQVTKQFSFEMRKEQAPVYVIRCSSPPDFRVRRC